MATVCWPRSGYCSCRWRTAAALVNTRVSLWSSMVRSAAESDRARVAISGRCAQFVAQDGDGVVADEAQVVEACGRGGEQRVADAGAVDFDADIARVRRGLCHLYEAFAVAKADFEVEVAVVAK